MHRLFADEQLARVNPLDEMEDGLHDYQILGPKVFAHVGGYGQEGQENVLEGEGVDEGRPGDLQLVIVGLEARSRADHSNVPEKVQDQLDDALVPGSPVAAGQGHGRESHANSRVQNGSGVKVDDGALVADLGELEDGNMAMVVDGHGLLVLVDGPGQGHHDLEAGQGRLGLGLVVGLALGPCRQDV